MTETNSAPPLQISVVVRASGSPERLRALIAALDAQTLAPERFEVIVVDGRTAERTSVDAREPRHALRHVRPDTFERSGTLDAAVRSCRADVVLFLDDAAVPAPDLLAVHVAAHAAPDARRAVLGAFAFSADAAREPFTRILASSDLLWDGASLRHGEAGPWSAHRIVNLSLPRRAWDEVGGFELDPSCTELAPDVEWGHRMARAGWSLVYRSDARCEHDRALTIDDFLRLAQTQGARTARAWKRLGDASILGLRAGANVEEEYTRGLQMKLENLLEPQRRFVEMLRRRAAELRGDEWPRGERSEIARLARDLACVPFARGALLELTGRDPVEVVEKGVSKDKLVSIVVCSYDALKKTQACVESLRRTLDRSRPIEILFVDNGSQDGSAEWLEAQPDLITVRNRDNVGAPRARNQATALARGEYLVYMDNDIVLTPEWLERLLHHAEVDPRSGCVAACADRASHRQDVPYEGPTDFDSLCDVSRVVARRHHRESRPAITLASFLMLVRRSVVDAIGGFDEAFSPWGFEDDDFTFRAHAAGFWNRIALDVFVHHDTYVGPKLERHTRLLAQNWGRFARKWGLGDASHGDMTALVDVRERTWSRAELHCALPDDPAPAGLEERRRRAREAWRDGSTPTPESRGPSPAMRAARSAIETARSALDLLGRGRLDDAARLVAARARESDGHPDVTMVAGLVSEQRALRARDPRACEAHLDEAAAAYERCLRAHPRPWVGELSPGVTSWVAATRLGTVRLLQGRDADAAAAFQQALRDRPGHVEATLGACEADLHAGQSARALSALQRCLTAPEPDAWILAAFACANAGQAHDARLFAAAARERLAKTAPIAPHRLEFLDAVESSLVEAPLPAAPEARAARSPAP